MQSSLINYIKDHFGSKKGLKIYLKHQLLLNVGLYRQYRAIDTKKVKRLVFICVGNICRSPLAEAIAKKYGLEAISFGLRCDGGTPADRRTIEFADRININLKGHVSRTKYQYEPDIGDLLLVMSPEHMKYVSVYEKKVYKIVLLGIFETKPRAAILDPYGGNRIFYEKCLQQVVSSVGGVIETFKRSF